MDVVKATVLQSMAVIFAPYLTWNREVNEIANGKRTANYPVDNWSIGTADAGASFDARCAMGVVRTLCFVNGKHGPDFDMDGASHVCADWIVAWDQGLSRVPSGLVEKGSIRSPDLGSVPIELLRTTCTHGRAKNWHFVTMTINELQDWARSLYVGQFQGPNFLFASSPARRLRGSLPSTDLDARMIWYAMLDTLFGYELEGLLVGGITFISIDEDE